MIRGFRLDWFDLSSLTSFGYYAVVFFHVGVDIGVVVGIGFGL